MLRVMESYFVMAGIALCAFALWTIARYDWVRLIRPSHKVSAQVSGHRTIDSDGGLSYAAIYHFAADGCQHIVIDQAYYPTPRPVTGTAVELDYPAGRPELARVPRPWTWLLVYTALIYAGGILTAKMAGWLP